MGAKYRVAVVGATGLVGRTILKILEERNFPLEELFLFSSKRSSGTSIYFSNSELKTQELSANSFENIDLAFFAAGGEVSEKYVPLASKSNCVVIDNSSYWRMDSEVPLVVPEVNPEDLYKHRRIISNPNCSTIQLVLPLKALHDKFNIKRVVVSTYQAISGAGQKGLDKLHSEMNSCVSSYFINNSNNSNNSNSSNIYNNNIYNSIMFHSAAENSDFTVEELKMINETRKILSIEELKMAVTCVRLPIENSHSISVNIELERPATVEEVKNTLANYKNIILADNINNDFYPTPQMSNGHDEVFVGRVRKDASAENAFYLWVVADNLRKGAATNAVQIAEKLIEQNLL